MNVQNDPSPEHSDHSFIQKLKNGGLSILVTVNGGKLLQNLKMNHFDKLCFQIQQLNALLPHSVFVSVRFFSLSITSQEKLHIIINIRHKHPEQNLQLEFLLKGPKGVLKFEEKKLPNPLLKQDLQFF